MNDLRFEKLGVCDFAVYLSGFADAIGKAGQIGKECWFQPRDDLGGGVCWAATMAGAVRAWAISEIQRKQLQRLIIAEMIYGICNPLPTVCEEDTNHED